MIEYETEPYETKLTDCCVFTTKPETKRISTKRSNKAAVWKYQQVLEIIDMKTGEIISTKEAKKLGMVELDYGLYVNTRLQILEQLRKEVKHLANFVLKFRNKRRGITPDLGTVLKYYSEITNKRYDNITRYRKDLFDSVMVNDYLCQPEFQFTGKNTTTGEHMSEDSHAGNVLFYELLRDIANEELRKTEVFNSLFPVESPLKSTT